MSIRVTNSFPHYCAAACILLMSFSQQSMAAGLERLFSTPAERVKLDVLRLHDALQPVTGRAKAEQPLANDDKPQPSITLNGVLRSDDGRQVIWINGVPSGELDKQQGIRIRGGADEDNRVTMDLIDEQRRVRIRPGQVLERKSGRVEDQSTARAAERNDGVK